MVAGEGADIVFSGAAMDELSRAGQIVPHPCSHKQPSHNHLLTKAITMTLKMQEGQEGLLKSMGSEGGDRIG